MDLDSMAKAFVDQYYTTFDTNRAALVGMFQEGSMFSFGGEKFIGATAIVTKLTSLQFSSCKHQVITIDCQASGPTGGMLVFVTGTMHFESEPPLKFSQLFHLMPVGPENFYVQNMFRVNYP
ncbi:unnamed protein product [Urochloa humidicola]